MFDQDPEVVNALAARKREAGGLEVMLQDRWGACRGGGELEVMLQDRWGRGAACRGGGGWR
jgi:hypothetical protein